MYLEKYLKGHFLWLASSFLSGDIGYMSFYLKMFSVEQKHQKPTNSLIDDNKQITNCRSMLKLWLIELLITYSTTLLQQQLNMC